MEHGLERKLKRELFAFCEVDARFYDSLSRYVPLNNGFLASLLVYFPAERIHRDRIWFSFLPSARAVETQGFKIHLSSPTLRGQELVDLVLPILQQHDVAFKVVVDTRMLSIINGKNYSRASSGKFFTIYPSREKFIPLAEALAGATAGWEAPQILTDRAYKSSRTVYYRYGAFVDTSQLTVYGDRVHFVFDPSGRAVEDSRTPYYTLPEWIEDPLPPQIEETADLILANRFHVTELLTSSNAGGVYLARDLTTQSVVIVKEARPHVDTSTDGSKDAVASLHDERDVVMALSNSGYTPGFVAYFTEWYHEFLVEERINGIPFQNFRALETVGLLVNRNPSRGSVQAFTSMFYTIAENLVAAVAAFHQAGYLVGDLSASNILVDKESFQLWLIDMEGCIRLGTPQNLKASVGTLGFISARRQQGDGLVPEDDYYAIGATLYSLILPLRTYFETSNALARKGIEDISSTYGLPSAVTEIIFGFLDGKCDETVELLKRVSQEPPDITWPPCPSSSWTFSNKELSDTIARIASTIVSHTDLSRDDRLWPADYRVFSTNPSSVAYGSIGIALFLQEVSGPLPSDIAGWIVKHATDYAQQTSGLYVGSAGIAWGLSLLGFHDQAICLMRGCFGTELDGASPDMFYGAAGSGLACLFFWKKYGEQSFLDRAIDAAALLQRTALTTGTGEPYWVNTDGKRHFGYGHGSAGIAYFFLQLADVVKNSTYLSFGASALRGELRQAREKQDMLVWTRSEDSELLTPYWRYGNAGIGSVLIRYFKATGDTEFENAALRAGRYADTKYMVFPGQFSGLSGVGEFFLDIAAYTAAATSEAAYDSAMRLAEGTRMFEQRDGEGIMYPGEELLRSSLDFGTGSAGIGLFLQRLLTRNSARLFYDL